MNGSTDAGYAAARVSLIEGYQAKQCVGMCKKIEVRRCLHYNVCKTYNLFWVDISLIQEVPWANKNVLNKLIYRARGRDFKYYGNQLQAAILFDKNKFELIYIRLGLSLIAFSLTTVTYITSRKILSHSWWMNMIGGDSWMIEVQF